MTRCLSNTVEFTVSSDEEGLSLLQCLQRRTRWSRKIVKRSIESKGCLRNNRIERFSSFRVRYKDRISCRLIEKPRWKVHYEDRSFTVYEKPSFGVCEGSLFIHRLDKETTGLVMVAKTPDVKTRFISIFKKQAIEKEYLAIVEGKCHKPKGCIQAPIGMIDRGTGFKLMGVDKKHGKSATTYWECLEYSQGLSLLRCRIITGRTHQIRVHLASIGLPVVGDHVYGASRVKAPRMLLHATKLQFKHPITGKNCSFSSPISWDKDFLNSLTI